MVPTELLERLEEGVDRRIAASLVRDTESEGLSRALFLRVAELVGSDPKGARVLASHWRAILAHSTDPAYALRTRAVLDRLDGRWKSSATWFLRAGDAAGGPVERLEHRIGAIDSLARAGAVDEAVRLGRELARRLKRRHRPDLAARAELNVGNALLWQDRYTEAAPVLERAMAGTDSEGIRAAAQLGLSTARLMGGRFEDVSSHAEAACRVFAASGMRLHAALCDLNLAHVEIAAGRAEDAVDRLLSLRPILEGDRFEFARLDELLGDAYLRINLVEAARDSYESALAIGGLPRLNQAHCRRGLAQAAMADGEYEDASHLAESAQRLYRQLGNDVWEAVARIARAQIDVCRGRHPQARRLARSAEAILQGRSADALSARAKIVAAELELNPMRARESARRALRGMSRNGHPDLRWRAHAVLARAAQKGALRHHRRMMEAILESRLRTRSTASRSAWMRDKGDALRAYLAALLERPTPARVQEALDAIGLSRSAALLDEILSSGALGSVDRAAIDELRSQLDLAESPDPSDGTRRRRGGANLGALQRRWVEATRRLQPTVAARLRDASAVAVFAQLPSGIAVLHERHVHRVSVDWDEFERQRRWLAFELLAPQADPRADPAFCERMLGSLYQTLVERWLQGSPGAVAIAPDGVLWGVPWAAMLRMKGDSEPVLVPSPAFGGPAAETRLPPNPRVALWLGAAPDLPHLTTEGNAVLDRFPGAVVCRSVGEARETLNGGTFDLIHVAAHGRLRADNPMFSVLSFPDGAISAAEIATSTLQAEVVTLSACESARMGLVHRDEPEGLGRAFLARGAKVVVGAAWPLSDEAAAVAMEAYCELLARGATVASSLRHARDVCRTIYRHPYYWGAMVALGGYASERRCE